MIRQITVETHVPAPPDPAWRAFTTPEAITEWNFAIPDWCCPSAQVDLRAGEAHSALTLRLLDGRYARTTFEPEAGGTRVGTVFDPESENPADMQRNGWQAILDNYAAYVRRMRT